MWSKLIAPYLLIHFVTAPFQGVVSLFSGWSIWDYTTMAIAKLLLVGSTWINRALNCASLNSWESHVPVVPELQATE